MYMSSVCLITVLPAHINEKIKQSISLLHKIYDVCLVIAI